MAAFHIRSCWLLLLAGFLLAHAGASESRLAPEIAEDELEVQAVALLQSDVRPTRDKDNFPTLSDAWHGLLRAFHRGGSAEAAPQEKTAESTPAEKQQELAEEKPVVVVQQPAAELLSGRSEAAPQEKTAESTPAEKQQELAEEKPVVVVQQPAAELLSGRSEAEALDRLRLLKYKDVDPVVLETMKAMNDTQAAYSMEDPLSVLPAEAKDMIRADLPQAKDMIRADLPQVEIPEDGQVPRAVDSPAVEMIPPSLVAVLQQAEASINDHLSDEKDTNEHARQETAEWILAIFGADDDGPLDGNNESAVVDRLTAFILRQNPTPAQEHGNWSVLVGGQPSKTFFNDNRVEALERMIERDNLQASRALANRKALMGQAGFGVNSHGAHSGYNQKFDLLPEAGRSDEAGHMWHIELTYNMDVDDNRLEVIGTGIVEHHRPAVAAAIGK